MTICPATCRGARDGRCALALVLVLVASLAEIVLAGGPDANEPLSPALAAQPLSMALAAYARHTGIQVIYVSAVVQGRDSAALPAGLVPAEALTRLLTGSGLGFEFINPRTVRILKAPHDTGPSLNESDTRGTYTAGLPRGDAQHANRRRAAAGPAGRAPISFGLVVPESAAWDSRVPLTKESSTFFKVVQP